MEKEEVGWCLKDWICDKDDVLFNDSVLQQIDCTDLSCYMNYGISIRNPGPGLVLRSLHKNDYDKGYMTLLGQLTRTGDVTKERFEAQFDAMKQCPGIHYIMVIEDVNNAVIVGSGTLVVERKFTHNTALRGRVEDIVVHSNYRGRHLGNLIVETATVLSQKVGCYKTSLDCLPSLKPFYEKFEFENTSIIFMSRRFYD